MADIFNIRTPQEILDSYLSEIKSEFPTSEPSIKKSFFNILGRGLSLIIHGNYLWLANLSNVPFVALCPPEFLDLHGNDIGLSRKPALGATGDVVCTGVDASVVSVGDRLVTVDGSNIQYEVTTGGVVSGGNVTVTVRSLIFGLDSNQDSGATLNFVTAPVGMNTEATVDSGGLDGGADLEADEPYRQRLLLKKRGPNQCGAPQDYVNWALAFPEVTRAFVFPKEDGLGTVRVRFMMDNKYPDGIPQPADETALKAFLEELAPAQVDIFVSAPVAQPTDVTLSITPDTPELRADVTNSIQDMILREAAPDKTIPLSKLTQAVSNTIGEEDSTISDPTGPMVPASVDHIITLGTVTFS